jgi:hypothetical protein
MPLCFVLMPFGKKHSPNGGVIDFDVVWQKLIKPAVVNAGLEPLRADEELAGGIIHKAMFERLILCEYAVADLTTANPNVLYELGVRHGIKPFSTTLIFAANAGALPFDVAMLRGLPYSLGSNGLPTNIQGDQQALTDRLVEARQGVTDSPLYQLVEGFPDIQRLKTDVFREQVTYSEQIKDKLAVARTTGRDAVATLEQELVTRFSSISDADGGIVIDLMLSYRAVEAWDDMIRLVPIMSRPLGETTLVREQLGFALNRAGKSKEAERILRALIKEKGPSSETCGILGRVFKDRWLASEEAGGHAEAKGWLKLAIDTYLQGFEADWRDAYPGVNAVSLMECLNPVDPRQSRLAEVVAYAVERRIAQGFGDYWDFATKLELAVLRNQKDEAENALADALARVRENWEVASTAKQLRSILDARTARGVVVDWAEKVCEELERRGRSSGGAQA